MAGGTAVAALLGHLALWDVAGALPVLQGAGGNITYLDDSPDDFSLEIVADGRQYPNSLLAGPAWALPYFKERIRGKIRLVSKDIPPGPLKACAREERNNRFL